MLAKASSYHPHRGPRQKQMSGQPAPGANTNSDPMTEKAVGYHEDCGKTQPKDRSLGMKRVKNSMAKKGL
jgi:hypothetical protein